MTYLRHPKEGMPSAGAAPILGRMSPSDVEHLDVLVVGAGPAGVVAAVRAARLGARTALITRDALGGIAAHDGPVPVRTLAHAARLIREARQLSRYGITAGEPGLDYPRLLERVREVTGEVSAHALLREELRTSGVAVHEHAGAAGFVDAHTVATANGPVLQSDRFIICTGGMSRRLPLPGFELTSTHSDAWRLSSVPPSMLVVGAGATGVQLASIFNAFGSQVTLFEAAPRILMSEDPDVAATVSAALSASGSTSWRTPDPSSASSPAAPASGCATPTGMRTTGSTLPSLWSRLAGWPTPPTSTSLPPGSAPTRGATCRWMPSFARRRRTCSPPAT